MRILQSLIQFKSARCPNALAHKLQCPPARRLLLRAPKSRLDPLQQPPSTRRLPIFRIPNAGSACKCLLHLRLALPRQQTSCHLPPLRRRTSRPMARRQAAVKAGRTRWSSLASL